MSENTGERTIRVAVTGEEPGEDRPAPSPDTLLAERYRLGRRIGKGGMGEVMAARDEQVGRDVAIKRMRSANPSERAVRRFLREASVQGRLEHPAIVPVHEIGRDQDGLPFFVMKKLAGRPLAEILVERDVDLQHVLRAFVDVCLAVEFAHVRGIVHRDLKPDNIVLGDYGEVYVLDWGVARVVGEDDSEFADVGSGSGEHATGAGAAVGTPGYMAPEQVHGIADLDGRADIYTLGCLLFELLAHEPLHPRGWNGMQSALAGVDARPSARVPGRDIPPELDALCVEATAKDRDARVATARELGSRVQRFLDGDRDVARRRDLANEHLTRARAAFEAGSSEELRRSAMRESAAALALDPSLAGAAELVGRLMLEPPRETPREVTDAMATDDVTTALSIARAGLFSLVAAVVFIPFVFWIAPAGSIYTYALGAILLANTVLVVTVLVTRTPRPGLVVVGNALVIVVVSRMFSPFLIAPGVAALLAMAMVLTPRFSWLGSSISVAVFMIAATLAPLVLERTGVLSSTVSMTGDELVFRAPAMAGGEGPTLLVGSLYIVGLILAACAIGDAMRLRNRAAHQRLHLQAWQLRQLVP